MSKDLAYSNRKELGHQSVGNVTWKSITVYSIQGLTYAQLKAFSANALEY